MKNLLLIITIVCTAIILSCEDITNEDSANDDAAALCKSNCSVEYEARVKHCKEAYSAGSDEREDCDKDAAEEQSECISDCKSY